MARSKPADPTAAVLAK